MQACPSQAKIQNIENKNSTEPITTTSMLKQKERNGRELIKIIKNKKKTTRKTLKDQDWKKSKG